MEESRGGVATFHIGAGAPYRGEEIVLKRKSNLVDNEEDKLVRWASTVRAENGLAAEDEPKASRKVHKDFLIWMSPKEISVCCPPLANKPVTEQPKLQNSAAVARLPVVEGVASSSTEGVVSDNEDELAEDVASLVARAKKINLKLHERPHLQNERSLGNTLNILNAYAKLGSLAESFRKCGALDLLLDLLSSQTQSVRRSASDMLRSLSLYDSTSRSYVLLQLVKLSSEETATTLENRQMLLDLFAETTQDEEGEETTDMALPQVPACYIYSLLKSYLRITSSATSHATSADVSNQFEYFSSVFHLLSEFFAVFGWTGTERKDDISDSAHKRASIFTNVSRAAASSPQKFRERYKTRSDFTSDSQYADYVQSVIEPGMRVRARVDYESIHQGELGEYRRSNDGIPPAQVAWDDLGDTYWVFWSQLEIVSEESPPTFDISNVIPRSSRLMSSLVTLATADNSEEVPRAQWWEVLCLIRNIPPTHLSELFSLLNRPMLKTFDDLLPITPTFKEVADIVTYLESSCPHINTSLLTVKKEDKFLSHYETTPVTPKEPVVVEPTVYQTAPPYPEPFDIEEDIDPSVTQKLEQAASGDRGNMVTTIPFPPKTTAARLMDLKKWIEIHFSKHNSSCKFAVQSMRHIFDNVKKIATPTERLECCLSGLLFIILKVIDIQPKSALLQTLGLECYFTLIGGPSLEEDIPVSPDELHPVLMPQEVRTSIITALVSVGSSVGNWLRKLRDAMECIINYYNLSVTTDEKRSYLAAMRGGLSIILVLLSGANAPQLIADWSIPELITLVKTAFPDFPTKDSLCSRILASIPGTSHSVSTEAAFDIERCGGREVIQLVKMLSHYTGRASINPLPRLVQLLGLDRTGHAPDSDTNLFLLHDGVVHLGNAMTANSTLYFTEKALSVILLVANTGEEEANRAVLQGGIRIVANVLGSGPGEAIIKLCISCFLTFLKYAELAVVMAMENLSTQFQKTLDRGCLISNQAKRDLGEMIEALSLKELHKMGSRNCNILSNVFSSLMQHLMMEIEDYRRSQTFPCIPFLSSFINFISSDSGLSIPNPNKCWEKIEVSSNEQRMPQLIDSDRYSYWESSGRTGTHWIKLHMIKNIIVKKLSINVQCSDQSYMPQRIAVQGGPDFDNLIDLSIVTIPSSHTGSYDLLSSPCSKYYPLIVVRIKRCQQGGIDARIRGLSIEGVHSSRWPLFGTLFTQRTQLFYHIQSLTWMKDLVNSPLTLFDRLSSVIGYEQSFADRYLLTSVSRQALGQACRSALFNPLVTSFKQNNVWGSILVQLLNNYMCKVCPISSDSYRSLMQHRLQERPLKRSVSELIYMSQIRRMCRLLVDVESSGTTPTYDETPTTKVSVISALAKSWKELVTQEVTKCLHKIDLSNPPLLVMDELVFVYDKLQQTTLELFGGHSQLSLALKEGFSMAFQYLDETNGVKLCEALSLCFNQLLDVTSKEGARLQHCDEAVRETVLFHLPEPLQFFHNLDISNIFEHFYRRHLSERLLCNRSISITMEKRLISSLSQCFPHKYPQQMLEDFEESGKAMTRFRQLYLLQQLDQTLSGCQGNAGVSGKVQEIAQKLLVYQEQSLDALVLTPHQWPVRHRSLPPVLPQLSLMAFVNDYTLFYTSVSENSLQKHEKVRQLLWTLYGHAILECDGKLLLDVSTSEMIVLLQFNQFQELTCQSLMENTQLPFKEVNDALLSLTAERQNILLSSERPTKGQGEYIFNPLTAFRVNQQLVNGLIAKEPRPQIRFNRTLNVSQNGRESELADLLERRRVIIDAAIVRLLKKEKKINIDSLVAKVIKGCSEGHFGGGVQFARFDSTYKDIWSRIERLILKGYIERVTATPQVLIYVPDPSQKEPADENKASAEMEDVDSTSLSLITRKRSGSSPIASTSKRKFLYLCDSYNGGEDDIHLVSISQGTLTQSVDDIEGQIAKELHQMAQVMEISTDQIEAMLYLSSWNKDHVLQEYFENREALFNKCGLSGLATPPSPPIEFPKSCPVCFSSISRDSAHWLWCQHVCCKSCWSNYLSNEVISLSHALSCTCFVHDCIARPTRSFLVKLLEPQSEVILEFSKAVVRSYVETSGWLTWCRNPQGCDRVLYRDDGHQSVTCANCGWHSCLSCNFIEAHQPCTCEQIVKWIELGGFYEGMNEDARSKHLANIISKRCPGCNAQIEKNEGCLHMKCKCGHNFCWRCMNPWQPTHTDYFKCSAKVSKAAHDSKKFADYNQRCTGHHKSLLFSERLYSLVKEISDPIPMKILSFLVNACQLLRQSYKMLSYTCVAEYFGESGSYLNVLSDSLEMNTIALQAYLENILMTSHDAGYSVRNLTELKLHEGYGLVNRVELMREKVMFGSDQLLRFGDVPLSSKLAERKKMGVANDRAVPEQDFLSARHFFNTNSNNRRSFSPGIILGGGTDEDEEEEEEDYEEDGSPFFSDHYSHSDYDYYDSYDDDDYPF